MYQTTRQRARETGIHHQSVCSIIHQDLQLKCLKKWHAWELAVANCILINYNYIVLQGRVGARKNRCDAIYILLKISSGMLLPKIMKIGSQIKKFVQK